MQSKEQSNQYFDMAVQYVNNTARHLFLTGKAGTGKTTFLKNIKENSIKKMAIIAPTGVAAINAGGVTIHSFFQLPFGSFIPTRNPVPENTRANIHNKQSLLQHLKLRSAKRELMQELELLIIDEVSMVRADLLDAIDTILRSVRRKPNQPFGGVQMLFIGDLFQLPPVTNEEEMKVLSEYYKGPFFFNALAIKEAPPIYLELKKIYRQSDDKFITLLNNIRNNQIRPEDLTLLNEHYKPDFKPEKKGEYITLTSHNSKADTINRNELQNLPGTLHKFDAEVKGEINDRALPAELKLQLKEGAQVMFIKNDKGEERRYYNGKLATVKKIEGNNIYVAFPESKEEIKVEKEVWRNVRYQLNKEIDQIDEKEIGTFTQYPLKLAWAITIHKSQGLTFEKAIIDAGDSFAAGQVYVALSRLTSLDGLVLYSKINSDCISTDKQAIDFTQSEPEISDLQELLKKGQKEFIQDMLLKSFEWHRLTTTAEEFLLDFESRRIPDQEEAQNLGHLVSQKTLEHQKIAEKFTRQLEQMIPLAEADGYHQLHERLEAAGKFFCESMEKDILLLLKEHFNVMKNKAKVKKYLKELLEMKASFENKKRQLEQIGLITKGLVQGTDSNTLLEQLKREKKSIEKEVKIIQTKEKKKPEKGESHRISLQMFKEGKNIEDIAIERSMAISTIEGHLISFIPTGEIEVTEIVKEEKIKNIEAVMDILGDVPSSQIKEKLGDEYTYGEIRSVINYRKKKQEENV